MNFFIASEGKTPVYKACINMILLTAILLSFFWYSLSKVGIVFDFSFVSEYKIRLFDGFLMTIYISVTSLVFSLILGLVSAICSNSKILILRYLSKIYVKFIRGTPLIMQIYLFYYIVGTAMGVESRFLSGVIILSVFEGAYISEIIRGSLLSLDSAQIEAGKAVGFTKFQLIRYVIFPQLITRTLPALTGQFASIIKDSSLLSIIAVIELTQATREITASTLRLFEAYFVLALLYLLLTLPITLLSEHIERKYSYEN